jgi:hypothetical protein
LRFVNDTHSAPADLAENPEVAQYAGQLDSSIALGGWAAELRHCQKRREQGFQTIGIRRVCAGQSIGVDRLACLEANRQFIDQFRQTNIAIKR